MFTDVFITTSRKYLQPEKIINKDGLNKIIIHNEKVKPFKGIPILGGLNWLWTYILLTIIISSILKKALKVY